LTQALFERTLDFPDDPDLVVLRVECLGENSADPSSGRPARQSRAETAAGSPMAAYRIDLLDFQDPETGFTAMERTTAFPAAIVTFLQATGGVAPGATPLETAVPAERFVSLLERRGFKIVHARL